MDRQRGRFTTEQAKQELERRGLWSYVEPVLTMGSAAFAEPVSGLMGLAALPYGVDASNRAIANTQEALTYQPRTKQGIESLQDLGEFMQPVGDAFIGASEYLGDAAYNATGSPALGAAAYSIPTMALEALGLKGASKLSKGRAYEMGDIGTQASKYGGKQRGIFAGVKAKGADLKQMEAAQELANRGVSRDEIWSKTGWFEDVDGKWKFEIDDSGARLTEKGSRESYYGSVSEALDHPEINKAYADVGDIDYIANEGNAGGSYTPYQDRGADLFPIDEQISVGRQTLPERFSTSLHELQHAVQEREGFAGGGSPAMFDTDISPDLYAVKSVLDDAIKRKTNGGWVYESSTLEEIISTSEAPKSIKDWAINIANSGESGIKEFNDNLPINLYKRLAGEAEARNVQTRLNYTPEQRRATPPWKTLDVPEDELIVRRGNGVAQSIDFDKSTGYSDVDGNISYIKEMSPDDYLQQAFEATDGRLGGSFEGWMASNARARDDVAKYAKAMQEGDKFPLPYIDLASGSQDGRNRALAAKAAGAKTIPVGIIEKPSASVRIAEIKKEMRGAKGYGLHRLKEELSILESETK